MTDPFIDGLEQLDIFRKKADSMFVDVGPHAPYQTRKEADEARERVYNELLTGALLINRNGWIVPSY